MSYDNQLVTIKLKKDWYLRQLKPPLGDPPHDTARQDIVSCILTSMHWTPDCWQSSRVQDVPKNKCTAFNVRVKWLSNSLLSIINRGFNINFWKLTYIFCDCIGIVNAQCPFTHENCPLLERHGLEQGKRNPQISYTATACIIFKKWTLQNEFTQF